MKRTKTALALALFAAFPMAQAQTSATTPPAPTQQARVPGTSARYAQSLVDSTAALHPELLQIDLHATAPGTQQSVIVATRTPGRLGRASDADDVAVLRTGQPRVEINKRGDDNVEVEVVLYDIFRQVIGTVEFTFPYPPGTDQDALVRKAAQIRDEMSRRILTLASLVEPAQFDARITARSQAQFLVDQALRSHPEVEVVVLHART